MPHNRSEQMLSYVNNYYRTSRSYTEQNTAKGVEVDNIRTLIDELTLQFAPQTATWGLRYWEELCGFKPALGDDYELRRGRVITQLSMGAPMTKKKLCSITYTATGAVVDILFTEQPYVMEALVTEFHRRFDVMPVKDTIIKLAPAHLQFEFRVDFTDTLLEDAYFASGYAECIRELFIEDSPDYFFIGREYSAAAAWEWLQERFIEGSPDAWCSNTFTSAAAYELTQEVFYEQ